MSARQRTRGVASVLYTPALDLERIHKARQSDADVCLIDLEDSIPPVKKAAARQLCFQFLRENPGPRTTAVRINELRSRDGIADLAALVDHRVAPEIIVMTMVNAGAEVEVVRSLLAAASLTPEIYVTVETPDSLENLDDIARESDGLVFGSADLAAFLGVDINWENMLYARQRIVHSAMRHDIAAIDTAHYNFSRPDELVEESRRAHALGFHGKAAVHPSQLEVIHREFRASDIELSRARRIVSASEQCGGGILKVDGNMIGPPFVRKARNLLRRAGR